MLKSLQQRDLKKNRWIKIAMTVLLLLICGSMLLYLIPGLNNGMASTTSPDSVANVGGQDITITEVQRQLAQMTQNGAIPDMLKGLYARQVLDQMVFQHALSLEAERLGITVTDEEETQRIKQILPDAWSGGVWQKDRYATEVQTRTGMSVVEFEKVLRDGMLADKVRQLVTDGIAVNPPEIQQEFRRRNEKVSIEYALIKPADLASTIHPADADLAAYFSKNMAKYQIPEKRSARYALLDIAKLRTRTQIPEDALRAYYKAHLDDYNVENRAHIEQILFKTVGMPDAEVAEVQKKATDILNQAKKGSNFEDLAKKNSDDPISKAKGGDVGWIIAGAGQAVPEVEHAAFSLPKGSISDLVKTQFGFQIIKVVDRETAHTKSFEEVRDTIYPAVLDDKVNTEANAIIDQMASAIRQSNHQPLDALARKFDLELGDTPPAAITEPVGNLGSASDLHQALFELAPGELSTPIRIDSGEVILTVKDVQKQHQGTLAEVHDKVLADYQQSKSLELAKSKADDLAKQAQAGTAFDKAAKSLDLAVKTSEPFARTGSVPDIGTGQQLAAAFGMSVGQVSAPSDTAGNWLVYRIVSHQAADPADLEKQKAGIEQQILQTKQTNAFAAFKTALEDRLTKEGKITINQDVMNRFTKSS
jgi:peptidyl-prolyl cis-trans isomerase D